MSAGFDPYHKWLGIGPKDQPPHLYRLLGVDAFETELDVIDIAADQRIRALRGFQAGPHGAESQKLLNEVAHARLLLLDPDRKAEYDRELRQTLAPQPAPAPVNPQPLPQIVPVMVPVPMPQMPLPLHLQPMVMPPMQPQPAPPQPAPPAKSPQAAPEQKASPAIRSSPASKTVRRKKHRQADLAKHIAASIGGLLIGFVVLGFLNKDWDLLGIAAVVRGSKAADETEHKPRDKKNKGSHGATSPKENKPIEKTTTKPMSEVVARPALPEPPPMVNAGELPDDAAIAAARARLAGMIASSDATRLSRAAQNEKGASLYVLLLAARDKAADDGDIAEALNYAQHVASAFPVDRFDLMTETLIKLAANCQTPAATRKLAELALEHFDEGVQLQKTDALLPLAELAVAAARKTDDAYLLKAATLKALDAKQSSRRGE
jgi:hypothetical protein